ncbi:DUF2789 family protein [Crenobacter caeni]|uniref:DUF2789 domain-containing protein n=1 Tax=Crenobacter caeni TaxID=2705474 RepID=A0A6B2KQ70_9NEIS|nr:DUF2789 family protein [Crenobacter caeni]NDV12375.1 DUF2789 domain-containing protein [Crenobacter caeni]
MHPHRHPLHLLFAQLGLAADHASIDAFIRAHAPLPASIRLEDAPFWRPAQSDLLREERDEDADWAEAVDLLDAELRRAP